MVPTTRRGIFHSDQRDSSSIKLATVAVKQTKQQTTIWYYDNSMISIISTIQNVSQIISNVTQFYTLSSDLNCLSTKHSLPASLIKVSSIMNSEILLLDWNILFGLDHWIQFQIETWFLLKWADNRSDVFLWRS